MNFRKSESWDRAAFARRSRPALEEAGDLVAVDCLTAVGLMGWCRNRSGLPFSPESRSLLRLGGGARWKTGLKGPASPSFRPPLKPLLVFHFALWRIPENGRNSAGEFLPSRRLNGREKRISIDACCEYMS